MAGIKEVVTLTSDLSRKNLEKDFERMDTPQGTFYRKSSLTLGSSLELYVRYRCSRFILCRCLL